MACTYPFNVGTVTCDANDCVFYSVLQQRRHHAEQRHHPQPGHDDTGEAAVLPTAIILDTSGTAAQKTLWWVRDTNNDGKFDAGDKAIKLATNVVNTAATVNKPIFTYNFAATSGSTTTYSAGTSLTAATVWNPPTSSLVSINVELVIDANLNDKPTYVDLVSVVRPRNVGTNTRAAKGVAMRRHSNQDGFALILLIGIMAALAILASMLVVMLDNQQHATRRNAASKTSIYYADAALSSAATRGENDTTLADAPAYTVSQTTLNQNYSASSGAPHADVYSVYDNLSPVNTAINYDSNGDGEVWVQASVTTYNGRTETSIVRELVSSSTKTSILPKAAAWTDTNMVLERHEQHLRREERRHGRRLGRALRDEHHVRRRLHRQQQHEPGLPRPHACSRSACRSTATYRARRALSSTKGGVGMLSDYFDQAHQAALMTEAQLAIAAYTNPSPTNPVFNVDSSHNPTGTSVSSTSTVDPFKTWLSYLSSSGNTWTAPTGPTTSCPAASTTPAGAGVPAT